MTLEFSNADALELCDARGINITRRNLGNRTGGYFYVIATPEAGPMNIGPYETPGEAAVAAILDLGLYRVKS